MRSPSRLRPTLALAALATLAFVWSWMAGRRGLFPLDQSIVLDGAWRMYSGQIPFVDFLTAHGLTPMGLQAMVFHAFGVSFTSYLCTAALMNAAATVLVVTLIQRLLPTHAVSAWIGGVVTALWFQPPFGTPYSEQTAFFFGLLSLWLMLAAHDGVRSPIASLRMFAAGVSLVLAFFAKQNAGLLFVPLFAVVAGLRAAMSRRLVELLSGALFATTIFAVWLFAVSDPATFVHAWFEVPSELAAPRLQSDFARVLTWIVIGKGNWIPRLVFLGCGGIALSFLIRSRGRGLSPDDRSQCVAARLCLSLILYQNVFNATTLNESDNGYAFAGLILALAISLVPVAADDFAAILSRREPRRVLLTAAVGVMVVAIGTFGIHSGWSRRVHTIYRHSEFGGRVDAPGWEQLQWGQPMKLKSTDIRIDDLNALISLLRRSNANFFVFPDWTFLYALVGRRSPQPVLWFHPGLTYSNSYDEALDNWIVRDLERNKVEIVVLETEAWMGSPERRLAAFPLLRRYIDDTFAETVQIGIFRVLERRDAPEEQAIEGRSAPANSH